MNNYFNSAINALTRNIKSILEKLPQNLQETAQEIRLRANKPLCITIGGKNLFISNEGQASSNITDDTYITTLEDVFATFRKLCEYSVYTYQNQINQGFITQEGGHRAGIYGTAVIDKSSIVNIKDISGLNLRIAREFVGCAKPIVDYYNQNKISNTVIIGMPSSGKTTLLRDLASTLSGENYLNRVCVVDERNEICAVSNGSSPFNLGLMCDCLDSYPKAEGIMIAIRCLSPQVLIFDEIGTDLELEATAQGFCAGVHVITSVHAANEQDFFNRPVCEKMLNEVQFDTFVFLSSQAGKIEKIYNRGELIELYRSSVT